jgi:hypothetical protein
MNALEKFKELLRDIFQFESSDLTWVAMLENRLRFVRELLSCREIVWLR